VKNKLVMSIIFAFISLNANSQQKKKSNDKENIEQLRVDTTNSLKGRKKYIRQQNVIDSFSPLFVKDIAQPGDVNHGKYKQYIIKGNALSEKTKVNLLQKFKKHPENIRKLNLMNADELRECKLIVFPVYYLTHNIALYNNESSLSPFFNLDTNIVTYRVMKNNRLLGMVKYQNGESFLRVFTASDSLSYSKIVSMHKEPLAFIKEVLDEQGRSNAQVSAFGYVSNEHIIFVSFNESNYVQYNVGNSVGKPIHVKECKIKNAESYYLGSDSTYANLPTIIDNGNKVLKFRAKSNIKN
jgi:hypothetical protein